MGSCVDGTSYQSAESIRYNALKTAAAIKQAAALAEFALSANDTVSNMRKLASISSRGLAVEEQEQAHLKNVYWPNENKFLTEFTQATPWDTQSTLAKRYAGRMWPPIAAQFAKKLKELEVNKPRYSSVNYIRQAQELLIARGITKANVVTLADRIAFAEVEAINDRDFDRRKAAIAMRQGLIGQAAALLSAAANGFAAAGQSALGSATNALKSFAYEGERARSSTQDPFFHAQTARDSSLVDQSVQSDMMGPRLEEQQDYEALFGEINKGNVDFGDDAGFGDMNSMQSFDSSDASATEGNNIALQGADVARSGRMTVAPQVLFVQGGKGGIVQVPSITFDLDKVDLASVENYNVNMEQVGPSALGSSSEGLVTYTPSGA
jgi:hypothetical protein